jgi:hypothetical protein
VENVCHLWRFYLKMKFCQISGIQTFLGDYPLTKHLFLKNSDIFEGIFL